MPYMLAGSSGPPWAHGTADPAGSVDHAAFDLTMVAPRSLLPERTNLVLVGLGVLLGLTSLRFVLLGAWPVLAFSVVDCALLAGALIAFRRTSPPTERLSLEGADLVRTLCPSGLLDQAPLHWRRYRSQARADFSPTQVPARDLPIRRLRSEAIP